MVSSELLFFLQWIGTRIDYTLATPDLLPWVQDADIMAEVMGSDHCPVYLDLKEEYEGKKLSNFLSHSKEPPLLSTAHHSAYRPSKNIHSMFQHFNSMKKNKNNSPTQSENVSASASSGSSPTVSRANSVIDVDAYPPEKRRRKEQSKLLSFFAKQKEEKEETNKTEDVSIEVLDNNNESDIGLTVKKKVENGNAWKQIFSERAPPLCEGHKEPCKYLTVRKPGINYGRKFWICARPVGELIKNSNAVSEEDTQPFQCRFFIWDSDWRANSKD